jgi:Zn-dependent metalloprotease
LILTIRELSHTLELIPTSQFDKLNSLADKTVITSANQNSTTAEVSKNVKEQVVATKEQKDTSGDTNVLLQGVIDAINILNKNLQDGKIAVNIDGSRASSFIARSNEWKGSFSSH